MGFFNTILDLVFPARCVACDKTGADLCLHCLVNFLRAEKENADWIFSVYDYQDPPLKKALWLFKYSGKKRLAKIFAEIIYEKILEECSELSVMENFTDPILIPIPLSPQRYRERGYNQAELICQEMATLLLHKERGWG